jgi:hypothetical protein
VRCGSTREDTPIRSAPRMPQEEDPAARGAAPGACILLLPLNLGPQEHSDVSTLCSTTVVVGMVVSLGHLNITKGGDG